MASKYYTQNDEERVIIDFFGSFKGTFVDIGANDGKTFSNTARLIELGWSGHMIEPHAEAYEKLVRTYAHNDKLRFYEYAIGADNKRVVFHKGSDSLLSTTNASLLPQWHGVEFESSSVEMITWEAFRLLSEVEHIDFLSIDAEGCDWDILQQIDLEDVKMLCIEVGDNAESIMRYCFDAGMKRIHRTHENMIFAK